MFPFIGVLKTTSSPEMQRRPHSYTSDDVSFSDNYNTSFGSMPSSLSDSIPPPKGNIWLFVGFFCPVLILLFYTTKLFCLALMSLKHVCVSFKKALKKKIAQIKICPLTLGLKGVKIKWMNISLHTERIPPRKTQWFRKHIQCLSYILCFKI